MTSNTGTTARMVHGGHAANVMVARAGRATSVFLVPVLLMATGACAATDRPDEAALAAAQDTTHRVAQVTGLSRPEAVRHDPEQDVWFVSNFGPQVDSTRDANGFISRVSPDGTIEELRFMTGTPDAPLHGPRGMIIRGDTLFVADADGVHGFDRMSGAHLSFVDMTALEPGFINDLAFDGSGVLYATDTGRARIYRIADGSAEIAAEGPETGPPNGITWDAERNALLLAPWDGERRLRAWDPATGEFAVVGMLTGGNFDGIEVIPSGVLITSQADSLLYVFDGETSVPVIRVPGAPADIGWDSARNRVAVPYIALDRVDIWELQPAQ